MFKGNEIECTRSIKNILPLIIVEVTFLPFWLRVSSTHWTDSSVSTLYCLTLGLKSRRFRPKKHTPTSSHIPPPTRQLFVTPLRPSRSFPYLFSGILRARVQLIRIKKLRKQKSNVVVRFTVRIHLGGDRKGSQCGPVSPGGTPSVYGPVES